MGAGDCHPNANRVVHAMQASLRSTLTHAMLTTFASSAEHRERLTIGSGPVGNDAMFLIAVVACGYGFGCFSRFNCTGHVVAD